MPLPVNIDELINGKSVERKKIEFNSIHPSFLSFKDFFEQVNVQAGAQANVLIIHNLDEIIDLYEKFGAQVSAQVNEQVNNTVKLEKKQNLIKILKFAVTEKNKKDILLHLNLTNSYNNYKNYVFSLNKLGLVELKIKDKPKSPNQKYKTTAKGLTLLEILK